MEFTEEEDSIENHQSLPPNYISLAQLRDQWLQKQMEKQIVEEPKGNQGKEKELKLKQPEREGKTIVASQRLRQEKGKKKVYEEESGRGRNEWKIVEGSQRIHVSKLVLGANPSEIGGDERQLKSEESTKQGYADQGDTRVGGAEEKIVVERKKKKKKKNWKKMNRANVNTVGALENHGNSGDSICIDDGEEKCKGGLKNGNGDKEVEGKVNVFMNGVLPENEEEENLLVMGAKCGYDKGFKEQDLGSSEQCRLVHSVFSVSNVELLPQSEAEEKFPVTGGVVNQRMLEAETDCMVVVSPEHNPEEDCSENVGGRSKRGKGRFGSRYKKNVQNQGNLRYSKDSAIELGCENNMQDGVVFHKERERNGVQKERTARATQPNADKKMVEDNPTPKIERNLRFLSMDENKEGYVALRKGGHGWQKRGFERSRDAKGLAWVKKGEISDSNAAAT